MQSAELQKIADKFKKIENRCVLRDYGIDLP